MADWLAARDVELVVCAGFMGVLTRGFLARFPSRVLNLHPSLLPAFPGAARDRGRLAAGVSETGVTVHLVDEVLDGGPIVAQDRVPVDYDETPEGLRARIHAAEHRLLPAVVEDVRPRRPRSRRHRKEGPHVTVKRALISVSDKTGLLELAHGLVELGVELIATTGTAAYLSEHNLASTRVEDLTGVAEMLGGRVKTLHPSVHGALLARRDNDGDQASLAEHGIEPIDLVIVNLYPFRHVAARKESSEGDIVEAIDIGGPAMVRAAAKNFAAVAVLVDPERYGFVLDELRESAGDLSLDTRRELAAEAFAHTAGYDIAIANWFSDTESFPERHLSELVKVTDLAYGENPHQRAAYYMDAGARRHLLSMVTQHGGKQLSFNNLLDLDAATTLAQEFTVPACVIVKHGNPCGVALAATPEEAYRKALAADPQSAFGGVVAVNRPLSRELAELVAEQFVEVLHAPGYGEGAVDLLRERLKNLRLLESDERRRPTPGERDSHRVLGGLLIQDRDTESEDRDTMEVVAGAAPTEREWGDLLFAWRVVKHVRSNAIVIARDTATVGIGAGQMSRIDSTRLALGKALSPVAGAVLASDAFFPFADGVQAALDAGVRVIIEPGGSKRDDEVIAAVEAAGGTLVFTGRRHFSH